MLENTFYETLVKDETIISRQKGLDVQNFTMNMSGCFLSRLNSP